LIKEFCCPRSRAAQRVGIRLTYLGCGGGTGGETGGLLGAAGIAEFAIGDGGNCWAEYPLDLGAPAGALTCACCAKAGMTAIPVRTVAMRTDVEFMRAVLRLAISEW
jgi:hypothetical protein